MNKIIKNLVYQKIHSRYKEIFEIDIDDINEIWIKTFIQILKDISINESKYKIKYFRLDSVEFDDYFSINKWKIILSINNLKNIPNKVKTIKLLNILNIDYKLNYKIELIDKYFYNELFDFIKSRNNFSFYIKSKYSRFDLNYIRKISGVFENIEVYIWLDYLNVQTEINNEIIYEIIETIKNNWGHINNDLIRLESAYKKLYILWPKELHLDLYEYCNASCNFCFTNWPWFLTERSEDHENKYKIQYKWIDLINLFRKISKSQTESVALWITWEPLLHPEINYILKELIDVNLKIWFLTNWYKLLENIELILQNKNINHFYINISAWDLESFKITRPTDNFNNFLDTWKAIKIIRTKRPDIIVRTLYVITPININWLSSFVGLCIKNNVSEIEFKRVVPYNFNNKDFFFSEENINNIIDFVKNNKQKILSINNNSDYIVNEFTEILNWKTIQYPEDEEVNKSKLVWKTINCYNPYFYLSIFRTSFYTCGKFEAKLWNLTNLDLYDAIIKDNNINNIIKSSENIKDYLWEIRWKEKCSRCHHLDVINMVKEYIKIRKIVSK